MEERVATCACGALAVTCRGEPLLTSACSCGACRRRTGGAFGVAVFYDEAMIESRGEAAGFSRIADNGHAVDHSFCPVCGSTVLWRPRRKPGVVAVAWGCFGDKSFAPPAQAVRRDEEPGWLSLRLSGADGG